MIDAEEYDDDWDEPTPTMICPECGSDDLERVGENDEGDTEFECNDCGEWFTDSEEEE